MQDADQPTSDAVGCRGPGMFTCTGCCMCSCWNELMTAVVLASGPDEAKRTAIARDTRTRIYMHAATHMPAALACDSHVSGWDTRCHISSFAVD